jgi:biofilm PGA synthesis protein PgaA
LSALNLACVSFTACALCCSATAATAEGCVAGESAAKSAAYLAGLAAFAAGRVEESYVQLKGASLACPGNIPYRNDYIVAAAASGHAPEALDIAAGLRAESLPTYVLEALGAAARENRQPDLALHYYDTILMARADVGAQVGRNLALIDLGDARAARTNLLALQQRDPHRVDILEALGLADEALGDDIGALAAVDILLEVDPRHAAGLKLRYRLLLRAGAPHLAAALTPPQLLTSHESGRGLRDRLAFDFRWARDDPGSDRTRAQRLDQVIERIRLAAADEATDRDVRDGLRGDLVLALAERGRSREAVAAYHRMLADGIKVEPYVSSVLVGAYVAIRQPRRAVALYRALPAGMDPPYAVKAAYFYALLESGQYHAAVRWADTMAGAEPPYAYANFPELRTENPDRASALELAALARSYTDRLADAERRLQALLRLAPADTDARLALADTHEMRGWPRRAAADSNLLLLESPSLNPLPQLFSDQMSMADWRAASATRARMNDLLPSDNAELLRVDRDWDTHQLAEASIEGELGKSYGGRPGVIDSEIGEYAYSPPLGWDYRAYVHLDQTWGTPVQGTTFRHAEGAGIEYHTSAWLATGELLVIDDRGPYPQINAQATPDDHWTLGVAYALRTLDIPIAAVVVGVHADRVAAGADYRVSESRDFGAQAIYEGYSDGNSRSELLADWRERWITGPIYKLDTRLDLDASRNTLDNTNYFNPKRDLSAAVTLQNQWLQFRHYESSLTHELDVGCGDYYQQGYGQGAIALLRYQAVYQVNRRVALKAGAGTGIRPYDGRRETLDVLTFNVQGRF